MRDAFADALVRNYEARLQDSFKKARTSAEAWNGAASGASVGATSTGVRRSGAVGSTSTNGNVAMQGGKDQLGIAAAVDSGVPATVPTHTGGGSPIVLPTEMLTNENVDEIVIGCKIGRGGFGKIARPLPPSPPSRPPACRKVLPRYRRTHTGAALFGAAA